MFIFYRLALALIPKIILENKGCIESFEFNHEMNITIIPLQQHLELEFKSNSLYPHYPT